MKKKTILCAALASALLSAPLYAEGLRVANTNEAAATVDPRNNTLGVSAGHWFTENFGLSAGASNGGGFDVLDVRGSYLLDDQFLIANRPARPYVGLGYAWVNGDYYRNLVGVGSRAKGAGFEFFGGLLWQTPWLKNFSLRGEARYSAFDVTTTVGGVPYDAGYNRLTALASAVIQF